MRHKNTAFQVAINLRHNSWHVHTTALEVHKLHMHRPRCRHTPTAHIRSPTKLDSYYANALTSLPRLVGNGILASVVAVVLLQGTNIDLAHIDHTLVRPAHAQSARDDAETKNLKEMSRNNTRASGKVANQFSLARRQASSGDLDGALATYNEIVSSAPDFAPGYSNRANIYVSRGRLTDGLADYDKALALAPLDRDSWVVFVNRGCTRLALGDDPYAALEDMNRAYGLRGDNGVVLSNRAAVWEILGKYDNAIRDYQTALDSNDVQPFWNRYALVLFQKNKSYEALSILRRVAARFDAGDVHAALAVIHFDRGDVAQAETEWSQVDRPRLYESREFLERDRKWPPRAIEAMDKFRHLKE